MSYCFDKGIPHSVFLRWDPSDRAKTIAYLLEKNQQCPMCGTAEWQWDEDPEAFEAMVTICPGCQRRDWGREELDEKPPGASINLLPKDTAAAIRDTPSRVPVRRRKR